MFLFGMLLGRSSDESLRRMASTVPTSVALPLYLAAVASYILLPLNFSWFVPLYGTASSLLFLKACYGEGVLNHFFSFGPLRFLGNISYSFYLLHALGTKLMVWLAATHSLPLNNTLSCALFSLAALVTSLAFASLSFLIAERWYFGPSRARTAEPGTAKGRNPTDRPEVIMVHAPAGNEAAAA
jgi:peptidoglycan/LPS O-acetylase OafA/YrhL